MEEDSGRLSLVDGVIRYESSTYGSWTLDVPSVRLVGECTNQNGPFADDYFLVFLKRGSNDWYEASFYAEGRDAFMVSLTRHLPGLLALGLCDSTDFKSRILWPAIDGDPELFDYHAIKRGDGLLDRLLVRIWPGAGVVQDVRQEFQNGAQQAGLDQRR